MNWKKGFRRTVFLCSMLMAVAGAFIGDKLSNSMPAMQEARRELQYASDPFDLVKRWNGQKKWPLSVVRSHKILWKRWTGEELPDEEQKNYYDFVSPLTIDQEKELLRIFEGPDVPVAFRLEPNEVDGQDRRLTPEEAAALRIEFHFGGSNRKLLKTKGHFRNMVRYHGQLERITEPFWREQGWEQVNGRRLPYSPIIVSVMIKERVRGLRLQYTLGGIVGGGISGFCVVWFIYLILGWLFSWVARGFCNTKENTKIQV